MARKGAFDPNLLVTGLKPRQPGASSLPKGAVGALANGIKQATRNAVQEIDPDLIDNFGVEDRIGDDLDGDNELIEAIKEQGQLVPALVRPSASSAGRYDIIYGRRRLRAVLKLRIRLKAIVQDLDHEASIIAQGQENSARKDLSFIEKCRFARMIEIAGYSRETIIKALNSHKTTVSTMMRVAQAIPDAVIVAIGAAPGIGRDRWIQLAHYFDTGLLSEKDALASLSHPNSDSLSSDEKFAAVNSAVSKVGKPHVVRDSQSFTVFDADERALGEVIKTKGGTVIKIPNADQHDAFSTWVAEQAETIIKELHERYRKIGGGEK